VATAYSYLRFSSADQAKGDSIRRQTEAAADWCKRNSIALDASLTLRDEGVSAFRGKNRENPDVHGMACFLQAVKTGRVPAGSFLILENLDRLTRESIVPAVNLFTGLLMAGVKIVQLRPVEHVFTAGADMTTVMLALVELSRGNSESVVKSQRIGAAWSNKQKHAKEKVITKRLPVWIKCENGKLVLDPARAAAVRRAFDMTRAGHSLSEIARAFNTERVPVPGRAKIAPPGQVGVKKEEKRRVAVVWSAALIHKIITSRACIGEYQPFQGRPGDRKPRGEPVRDYYPPVVGVAEFEDAQKSLRIRATVGRGRRGKHVHLFAGLLRDARTGGTFICRHLTKRESVLFPAGAVHGRGGNWISFPLRAFEEAVRSQLVEVKIEDAEAGAAGRNKIKILSDRQDELDTLTRKWRAKMDRPELVDVVADKLAELEQERRRVTDLLGEAHAENASPLSEAVGHLRTVGKVLDEDNSDENRLRCRAAIRRLVSEVWCLFRPGKGMRAAVVQVVLRNGLTRSYMILHRPAGRSRHGEWPAILQVRSFAEPEMAGGFDLRNAKHVAACEKLLSAIDTNTFAAPGTANGKNPPAPPSALPRKTRKALTARKEKKS
jgi:DNA invertase Pin-like site-specific DNA recombinase